MNAVSRPLRGLAEAFVGAADRAARLGAAAAALLLVYMVGHIVLEILLRGLWSTSTFVLDEFIGFAVAASAFLGLAEALRVGKLIRIDLIVDCLPRRLRTLAFLAAAAVTFGAVGLLTVYVWRTMARDFLRQTVSTSIAEVPMWVPTALIFAGLLLFLVQLAAQTLRHLGAAPGVAADPGQRE